MPCLLRNSWMTRCGYRENVILPIQLLWQQYTISWYSDRISLTAVTIFWPSWLTLFKALSDTMYWNLYTYIQYTYFCEESFINHSFSYNSALITYWSTTHPCLLIAVHEWDVGWFLDTDRQNKSSSWCRIACGIIWLKHGCLLYSTSCSMIMQLLACLFIWVFLRNAVVLVLPTPKRYRQDHVELPHFIDIV